MAKNDDSRRGPLSQDEKTYIRRYASTKSADQMAAELKRNARSIRKYITENNLYSPENDTANTDDGTIIGYLHSLPWWPSTQEQLSTKELDLFEQMWLRLYKQFDQDVLTSEEIQIRKYITLEIMKDRVLKRVRTTEEEIEQYQEMYQEELARPNEDRDRDLITSCREELSARRNAAPAMNREFQDLCKEQNSIEKGLSASRNDRIKNIQDATKNWSTVLKILDEPESRKQIGVFMEIMKEARDKEMKRLTSLHKYVDNEYDYPILSGQLIDFEESGNESDN